MANCSNNHGCSCGGRSSCTHVGALSTLSCTGSYSRFPYYTGPCPPKPCSSGCGGCSGGNCCGCSCAHARVTGCDACGSCGCNGEACGCNGCGGCDVCNGCDACGCDACNSCGCDNCGASWNCSGCGCSNYGYARSCANCGNPRPCGGCGCSACGCGGSGNCGCTGHAVFSAGAPIALSPGGTVTLTASNVDPHYFAASYGSILIRRSGLYYVAVTVDIPGNTEVDTTMRLELDNQNITPPEIVVTTTDDDSTANFAGHTVFHANAGSLLKLSSLRDFTIPCNAAQPIFTLTLIKIR